MSVIGLDELTKDESVLEHQMAKKGAVLFRTNEHIIKLLLWQDMAPVRSDLYHMVEILQTILLRKDLPDMVRNLIVGLQGRLVEAADTKHYEDLINHFMKFKSLYHNSLNIYFLEDCAWWIYYLWWCRQWRMNVVAACTESKYFPVDSERIRPERETFKHTPECDIRMKALQTYLKFFGADGRKFLKANRSYADSFNIKEKLRQRKAKDKKELEYNKRPVRALAKMTRRDLHDKHDGIETRYNKHIILIPDKDEIITELEYIERLERRAGNQKTCYSYSQGDHCSDTGVDLIERATAEHYGRAFFEYRKQTHEIKPPFDKETGELTDPVDQVDKDIRSGKKKEKTYVEDLELKLELAKRGAASDDRTRVKQLFTGPKAAVSVKMTTDELLNIFDKDGKKSKSTNLTTILRENCGKDGSPNEPKVEVRLVYDGDGTSKIETHPIHRPPEAMRLPPDTMMYEKFPLKRDSNSKKPFPPRPPVEHLPEDISKYCNVLEIKDTSGHYIIATCKSGDPKDNDPAADIAAMLKMYSGRNEGKFNAPMGKGTELGDKIEKLKEMARNEGEIVDPDNPKYKKRPSGEQDRINDMLGMSKTGAKSTTDPPTYLLSEVEKEALSRLQRSNPSSNDKLTITELPDNDTKKGTAKGGRSKLITRCYVCNVEGYNKKCGRCMSVSYCSKQCQLANWQEHKAMCRLIREEMMIASQPKGSTTEGLAPLPEDEVPASLTSVD